jgi:uncharacterized protein YcbX
VRITGLAVHPIKGCHRVEVDRAVIGRFGLVGDREWQVVRGQEFVTQRTHPQLTRVRPVLAEGGVVLRADGMADLFVETRAATDTTTTTYSGTVDVADGGDDAAGWCSELLGEPVRLVGIAPGYKRHDEVLFPTEGNLSDSAPILVVNEASHRFLLERAVEPFGIERWRANVVVDAGEPWIEDTWKRIAIGDAEITCCFPWPRCAVPQVDQEDGSRHREPAVVLKKHRWCAELPDASKLLQMVLCGNALFGMASSPLPVGAELAVGDEVTVSETGAPLI